MSCVIYETRDWKSRRGEPQRQHRQHHGGRPEHRRCTRMLAADAKAATESNAMASVGMGREAAAGGTMPIRFADRR